ncbi:MAG: oligosaccharide flippase family protein [Synergistaceae bacterium]|nr:oligosaccharide flippase family protein [Synergistaceae bacterium]
MSRQGSLIKNTLIFSIGTVLPKFSVFITSPILTGCLTKNEYGMFDLIFTVFSMALPVATLNIHAASFRYLIDARGNPDETKSIISSTVIFSSSISAAALVPLFFMIPGNPAVRLLSCVYLFVSLSNTITGLFTRGVGRNLDYSLSAVVNVSFKVLFIVVFLWWFNAGLTGAVAAILLSSASSMMFLILRTGIFRYVSLSSLSLGRIRQLISYSFPNLLDAMCWWVINASDRIIVSSFLGLPANAAYAVAHKIPGLLNLAQSTFGLAWSENASLAMKDNDRAEYYTQMFRALLDFMAGLLGLIIASTPILFAVLIKGDYSDAYTQMPLLFMASFFSIICSFLGGIYMACKEMKGLARTTFMAAACNVTANLVLIKFIGLYAASLSTVISYVLVGTVRMRDVREMAGMKYDVMHMILVVAFLSLMAVLCCVRNIFLDIINIIMSAAFFTVLNKGMILAVRRKLSARFTRKKSGQPS